MHATHIDRKSTVDLAEINSLKKETFQIKRKTWLQHSYSKFGNNFKSNLN